MVRTIPPVGKRRRHHNFNLANWLVGLGLLALVISFAIPYILAERTARLEQRAEEVAAVVLDAAVDLQPLDLTDPFDRALLEAWIVARLEVLGIKEDSFTLAPPLVLDDVLVFRGKHYEYLVTPGPQPMDDSERVAHNRGERILPFEVYAYPARSVSPAQTAFFFSEIDSSAFTRNLQNNYKGDGRRPRRGNGVPRVDPGIQGFYRGRDDERWLFTGQIVEM